MSEKCPNCEQILKENKLVRKALTETNKNFVETVNENLALRREIEGLNKLINRLCDSLEGKDFHDSPPAPLVADPALVTSPKIWGAPKKLVEEFDELCLTRWERFVRSLKQEKDKWK